ncbi:nucleotidyltransferase [Rhodococcus opacus]|uniref:nucleotidyltransferase n=1 Tax=Rhodococcus opacus TaxID=37919 RepID=UPI0029537CBF|nr:nucleotidyltransferase [Rhodococcus opacus]MDV7091011.1 nucleotidyltransferase [Rhodococcus opacus]
MTSISAGIDDFLQERKPQKWHRDEVSRYRECILGVLESEFTVFNFFQSGSFQHGTAVTPYSDVDYMACLSVKHKTGSSTTILNKVRDLFKSELVEAREIYVDRPTVKIEFPGLVTDYEITPAFFERNVDGEFVRHIPARGGTWREAAPEAHLSFVADVDQKHHGGVRMLARLLKAWKYEHSVPISSFYLEMRAAEYGKNNDSLWSLYSLRHIVSKLVSSELAAMNDPARLVNRIMPCSGESNRATALACLRTLEKDLIEANRANDAGERWKFNQALQAVWGSEFPYVDADTA